MAGFEGTKWAKKQFCYILKDRTFEILESDAKVHAVSRSIHYGMFLAFEGIRFFCKKKDNGKFDIIFLNLRKNVERFRRGISFNLSSIQQGLVPSVEEIEDIFLKYFRHPDVKHFLSETADLGAQGYFRPFTFDEEQSIGVTFPANPAIRGILCRYDRYLGEPFIGVVVPNIVRAVGINGTGCLKLGINYPMSIKAVDFAKQILPEAGAALLLDDKPYLPLEERCITEWDSSCCLFGFRNETVVKIPEGPLLLPSITIAGICEILKQLKITVEERDLTYGELVKRVKDKEIVVICSVGTAGIVNRAQKLLLVNNSAETIAVHTADESHPLYQKFKDAKDIYWDIYKEKRPVPPGLHLDKFEV